MAPLISARRTDPAIDLHATVALGERLAPTKPPAALPRVGWPIAAVGGAWVAAICGWLIVTGLTVLGWLAAGSGSFTGAMTVGTQLWLLANGSGARLGGTALTLTPWGATAGLLYLVFRLARFAAHQSRVHDSGQRSHRTSAALVTALVTLAYALPVLTTGFALNGPPPWPGLLSVLGAVALCSWWGSCRGLALHATRGWPLWCRALPRAVLAGQLTLVAVGSAALAAGLVVHHERVLALTDGLHAGLVGGFVLGLVQLAFVPNAVVWAASYALGAGFTLGPGTLVSLTSTSTGLLPSVPLLGALPAAGPGQSGDLWWLTAGCAAGGVTAWIAIRARPTARVDETSLVGALSGLLTALVFVGLAWASGGSLGVVRLADLGPRLLPLLVMSAATMGLAGMFVGLVLGVLRRRPDRPRPRRPPSTRWPSRLWRGGRVSR
jgi:hypothetical protein